MLVTGYQNSNHRIVNRYWLELSTIIVNYVINTGCSIWPVRSNHTLKTEKISLSLKTKLFFQPQHREFLIFSCQKIHWSFSNYSYWKTFEVHKCESMENALKIKVFIKSILFCKYLRNGSLDLYEILCGGQLLSCELRFQILWRSVHKWAHTSCKRARAFYRKCGRLWLVHAHLSSDLH